MLFNKSFSAWICGYGVGVLIASSFITDSKMMLFGTIFGAVMLLLGLLGHIRASKEEKASTIVVNVHKLPPEFPVFNVFVTRSVDSRKLNLQRVLGPGWRIVSYGSDSFIGMNIGAVVVQDGPNTVPEHDWLRALERRLVSRYPERQIIYL